MWPGKLPRWAPQAFGYTLSAACLIWVLHGYPLSDLIATIRSLDWRWVILAVLSDLGAYVAHAWRWNTLLSPVVRLRLWRTVQSIYIGLFANEVLPLRTGEVIRAYLLAHWNNVRLSLVLASIAVERLIDGVWIIAVFFITASLVKGVPKQIMFGVEVLAAAVLMGTIALIWIVARKHQAHAIAAESRWAATLRHVIEGLHLMGNPRSLGQATVLSLLCLFLQILPYYALMKAFGLDLSFWVSAGVVAIVRLGTVVPNAPGNVGVFQFMCVLALGLFDVEKNDAKTFSFVTFFALTLPLLIGGAVATALTGLKLGELRTRAHQGIAEADSVEAAEP